LRYTLAHELGHLVLHSQRRFVDVEAEEEANRFAGAFMLPAERMREALGSLVPTLRTFQYMKAHWGVSMQAIIMRGADLGLLDANRKRSLFKQLSARQWRKSEPVTVHREEPTLVWRLLVSQYGDQAVYQRAQEQLGLGSLFLRSLAPKPTT
jgi:Zn-dependent peptidase ImmA (M78 family)